MIHFRNSYEEYYLKTHGSEWKGNILEKNFLNDLKSSMEKLFDLERKINPEF